MNDNYRRISTIHILFLSTLKKIVLDYDSIVVTSYGISIVIQTQLRRFKGLQY